MHVEKEFSFLCKIEAIGDHEFSILFSRFSLSASFRSFLSVKFRVLEVWGSKGEKRDSALPASVMKVRMLSIDNFGKLPN